MNQTILQDRDTVNKLRQLSLKQQNMVKESIDFLYQKTQSKEEEPISFLEDAQEFIGCVDGGPGDLATNKKYLEGFGIE